MCLQALFKCFHGNKLKGVCIFTSLLHDKPLKVKVTAVRHRLGCRLGMCSYTHVVTFHFKDPRKVNEHGHFSWTSRLASVNMDKMLRHRFDHTA